MGTNDTLNGSSGNDTLNATLTGAVAQTVRPTLTSIETIEVTSAHTGGTTGTLDLGSASGYTALRNISSTGNLAFGQIGATTVTGEVVSASGTTTFNFTDAASAGTDVFRLTLNGATGGITLSDQGGSNALETVAITATGSASNLGAGGLTTGSSSGTGVGTTSVTIAGAADINLGTVALATQVLTVNASTATGAVTAATGASTAGQTITGGAGNDTFTLGGTQSDSVSGGEGNDTFIIANGTLTVNDTIAGGAGALDNLVVSGGADYALADATFANVTGVERLSGALVAQGNTAGVDVTVTADTAIKAAGITRFSDAASGDSAFNLTLGTAYNGTAVTYDFSDVADTASFIATAAGTTAVMTFQGDADGLTAGDSLVGGASSGDTLVLDSAGTTGTIANGDIGGIERISITATNGSVTLTSVDTQITDSAATALAVDASAASSATTVTLAIIAHALNYTGNASADSVSGGAGNDNIVLGAGNDTYVVATANFTAADTISGGDGNDIIALSDAATVIDADFTRVTSVENISMRDAAEALTITLDALANAAGVARVNGNGAANDTVTVTAAFTNALRVAIGDGSDTVNASASASVVTVVVTEAGLTVADVLTGGSTSNDVLSLTADGGTGDFTNVSGFENFTVSGDAGAVGITTVDANIDAGATLTVNASALVSGANALTFSAAAESNGKVVVTGGGGSDAITLTANGADSVAGGSGNDTFTLTSAGFTVADTIAGGDGNDIIAMSDSATVIDADFTNVTSVQRLTSTGTANTNTLTATVGALALAAGVSSVIGGTGVDTLTVDAAYTGTIRFTPTSGSDVVTAASSTATLQVATALGQINAGDTWTGGTGSSDELIVTSGTATATTMANITAFERITTSADDAAFSITTADANVASGITMTVNAASLISTNALTFDGSAETNGKFSITGGNAGDTITGGAGVDTIDGGAGSDSIDGGSGDDSVLGGLGDDTITASSANDFADGGVGTDRLVVTSIGSGTFVINLSNSGDQLTTFNGSANATIQQGFEGADLSSVNGAVTATAAAGGSSITTGSGNDVLNDGAGADTLTGGIGNDTITSSAGVDSLVGGAGNDRYVVTLNSVGVFDDTITDTGGTDTVVILGAAPSSTTRATLNLTAAAFGTNVIDSLDVTGLSVAGADITTSTGATTVLGSDFADSVAGNAGADSILGGGGADTLIGDAAADTISGGDGADAITGGAGADNLTGGAGADTFVMVVADVGDTITDFAVAADFFDWNTALSSIDASTTVPTFQAAAAGTAIGATTTVFELTGVTGAAGAANLVTALGATATNADTNANILFVYYLTGGGAEIYNWINADADVEAAELTLVATLTGVAADSLVAANFI